VTNNELTAFFRDTVIFDQDYQSATDANADQWLRLAYGEFRSIVTKTAPEFYEISYTPPTLTGVFELDLNGVLFGTTVTQKRCQKMTRILAISPTAPTGYARILEPCASFEELRIQWGANQKWFLDGHTLKFNFASALDIQIWYYADPDVSFLDGAAPAFIDDLGTYHDLIALLASRYYRLKTGISNPMAEELIAVRSRELKAFIRGTRSGRGGSTVRETYRYGR